MNIKLIITVIYLMFSVMILTEVYAQNQPKHQPEKYWSTYEDQILGIKVQYPKGWEVEEIPNAVNIDLRNESKPVVFSTVAVNQVYPNTDTSEKLMKIAMNMFRGDILKINSIDDTVTLDNKPAYKADYTRKYEDGTEAGRTIIYFLVNQDATYIISFIVMADKYEEYYPIIQKMVDSFEILS